MARAKGKSRVEQLRYMNETGDNRYEVSVIVPVYNAERTIERTLESIRSQGISGIEIVCINDGSVDNSLEVLQKQNDIVVTSVENQGPGHARNVGLSMARGKYIFFCDADDIILPGALKHLLSIAKATMANIVVGRYQEQDEEGNIKVFNINFTDKSEMVNYFAQLTCTSRLYDRNFLKKGKIFFPDMSQGEDRLFLSLCYEQRPSISFTNKDVYAYIKESGKNSLMSDNSVKAFSERLSCWNSFYSVCSQVDMNDTSRMLSSALFFLSEQWNRITSDEREIAFQKLKTFFNGKICSSGEFNSYFKMPIEDFWLVNDFEGYSAKYVENSAKKNGFGSKIVAKKEKVKEPLVTVIIPAFNSEQYITKCLLSVITQKLESMEIICVNDLSTDSTGLILDIFAAYDKRIQCIQGEGRGAGAARNLALKLAKGKYLCFLDSDDFFDEKMLSSSVIKSESEDLDICLWGGVELDNVTKKVRHNSTMLIESMLPDDIFAGTDCKFLFNMTTGAPWNKLFRRDFFEKTKVSFMEQTCFNDLYAMFVLLSSAKRIGVLREELLTYRVNNKSSLQGAKDKNIEDAFNAFDLIENRLVEDGLLNENLRLSLSNYLLSCSIFILKTSKSYDSFCKTYDYIKNCSLINELDETNVYDYCKEKYLMLEKIKELSREEYLFESKTITNEKVVPEIKYVFVQDKQDAKYLQYLKNCEYSLMEVRKSFSYRLGRIVSFLPRLFRHVLFKKPM